LCLSIKKKGFNGIKMMGVKNYMKKVFLVTILACILIVAASVSFATAGSTSSNPLWAAGNNPNKIIVISDLHLGINDKISETVINRQHLVNFLKSVQQTKDVRELVIAGDFLDDWFLPLSYPAYSDTQAFYTAVIKNNQSVFDELNKIADKGIKVVYTPGNHDMLLEADTMKKAMPKMIFVGADGLGTYITGDRQEIAIEHGNRYDIFSAPDTVNNAELTGGEGILPPGYFYARIAASWILQGKPPIVKDLPEVALVPSKTNVDQYEAYVYYNIWNNTLKRFTNIERFDDKVFNLKIGGFNGKYTVEDIYPVVQANGSISAPTLFKNFQRTWDERQKINGVNVNIPFLESAQAAATGDVFFFSKQAAQQYADKNIDIVVFGHTHYPLVEKHASGITNVNAGTWIDHNTSSPTGLSRTFAVITTGQKSTSALYTYETEGKVRDVTKELTIPSK
jgi:UDP-2,3-diacylglucosamine pyrophosphatase LpxH